MIQGINQYQRTDCISVNSSGGGAQLKQCSDTNFTNRDRDQGAGAECSKNSSHIRNTFKEKRKKI